MKAPLQLKLQTLMLRLEAYLRNVDAKNSEASGEKKKIKAIYYALQQQITNRRPIFLKNDGFISPETKVDKKEPLFCSTLINDGRGSNDTTAVD